jgi:leader peptidase (prepilin peptidase) / N-methyltransferase
VNLEPSDAWASSPAAYVAAAVLGALWGSFFNVCIARIPRGLSVIKPRSHCFACGTAVRPIDNVPILSYLALRGRCRACRVRYSPRHLVVEVLAAALSVLLYWKFLAAAPELALGLRAARYAVGFAFTGVLLVLSFVDLETKRLPDVITLPAIPLFFLAGFATGGAGWLDRLIGGAAGYLVVRIIADGYYYLKGREGLGLGDGKLLALIGVVLGWRALPVVVFSASFIGVAVSVPLLLLARQRQSPEPPPAPAAVPTTAAGSPIRRAEVPFGPFLALSAFAYLLLGQEIWLWFTDALMGH